MHTKIKDLTVDELKLIISDSIKENLQDITEDLLALSSRSYIDSIEEAREDYKKGKTVSIEDIL